MGQLVIDARGKAFRADLAKGEVVLSFRLGLDEALEQREYLSHICEMEMPVTLTIETVQLHLGDASPAPASPSPES